METVFLNWDRHTVEQKDPATGCIPWSYEVLLRVAETPGIDFSSFQEQFDLGPDHNHFVTVARKIEATYPHVKFQCKEFATGKEKIEFLDEQISSRIPSILSLPNQPLGLGFGFHMMPVVEADEKTLRLLHRWQQNRAFLLLVEKAKLIAIHDTIPGGKEVAWLENQSSEKSQEP